MTGEERRAAWLAGLRGPDGQDPEPWQVEAATASMDAWDAAERAEAGKAVPPPASKRKGLWLTQPNRLLI